MQRGKNLPADFRFRRRVCHSFSGHDENNPSANDSVSRRESYAPFPPLAAFSGGLPGRCFSAAVIKNTEEPSRDRNQSLAVVAGIRRTKGKGLRQGNSPGTLGPLERSRWPVSLVMGSSGETRSTRAVLAPKQHWPAATRQVWRSSHGHVNLDLTDDHEYSHMT